MISILPAVEYRLLNKDSRVRILILSIAAWVPSLGFSISVGHVIGAHT